MALSDGRRRQLGRLRTRRKRMREGRVLVEGVRGVEEALAAPVRARWALVSPRLAATDRGWALLESLEGAGVELVREDDGVLSSVSATGSPQGVLLVVDEPEHSLTAMAGSGGRYLVLDGIQDPGNVGTLVRSALAFALTGVVVLDGSADPWGAKAVRSAAGACFRLPLAQARWPDVRSWLGGAGVPILVADARGRDVTDTAGEASWALVVGSEGRGVRREVERAAQGRVAVPMPGGAESLNAGVAGAILLFALTRGTPNV